MIGRSGVVASGADDFGLGEVSSSLTTGNCEEGVAKTELYL